MKKKEKNIKKKRERKIKNKNKNKTKTKQLSAGFQVFEDSWFIDWWREEISREKHKDRFTASVAIYSLKKFWSYH